MRYIISCILLFATLGSFAQEPDTVKISYAPTGLRIGVDAVKIGRSLAEEHLNTNLFTADIDFYRYFLVVEYGQYSRKRISEISTYQTDGGFFRAGVDVNFFHRQKDKSVLSFGLRYADATFSEELTSSYSDPYFGSGVQHFSNKDLNANWMEIVGSLKVPVWKFWLGYSARLKFWAGDFEDQSFKPYEIPGYGYAADKGNWEFNYYIMYRIGWK